MCGFCCDSAEGALGMVSDGREGYECLDIMRGCFEGIH